MTQQEDQQTTNANTITTASANNNTGNDSNSIQAPDSPDSTQTPSTPLPHPVNLPVNNHPNDTNAEQAQSLIDDNKQQDKPAIVFQTVAFDARFPNQNQTTHCWRNYVDYFRCITKNGEEYKPCNQYKFAYQELCPKPWLERWDSLRENGLFDVDFND